MTLSDPLVIVLALPLGFADACVELGPVAKERGVGPKPVMLQLRRL